MFGKYFHSSNEVINVWGTSYDIKIYNVTHIIQMAFARKTSALIQLHKKKKHRTENDRNDERGEDAEKNRNSKKRIEQNKVK